MLSQLPPVGEPIQPSGLAASADWRHEVFAPYTPYFYHSGTAALAAAILVASRAQGKPNPEVILPAYGCPDLVSAALHAGAKPVLADLEVDRPWMAVEVLEACVNPATIAIVATHLFGIPERMAALSRLSAKYSLYLIEDSAQAFPLRAGGAFWSGNLVVLSFGRGKPVSLLGGGALLVRQADDARHLPVVVRHTTPPARQWGGFFGRVLVYNLLLSRYVYWLPQTLPLLRLGVTRFKPLNAIAPMDSIRVARLGANIQRYRARTNAQAGLMEMLAELNDGSHGVLDLPRCCGVSASLRLLRYPLLVDPARRDRVFERLVRNGLGPARMYPAPLPLIEGMDNRLTGQAVFPQAARFANSILTLPTHTQVRRSDIDRMRQILSS